MNFKQLLVSNINSIMMKSGLLLMCCLIILPLKAQDVMPELQIGTRGYMSVNGASTNKGTSSAINDFSDSALLLGFREHLFSDYRSRLVIGFQFPDADANLGPVFYHQVMFELNSQYNHFRIGRTRLPSSLIEFTTQRDDDALHFTDVVNPFSDGGNTQATQYGNILEYGRVFDNKWWVMGYAAHYTESPLYLARSGFNEDFAANGGGLSFSYMYPETQIWNRPIIQQAGMGLNLFNTPPFIQNRKKELLTVFQFSSIINIKRDPVNFFDLRSQVLYNGGFSQVNQVNDYFDYTRTESMAFFAMVRYLKRDLEFPSYQISAGGGIKAFPNLSSGANQYKFLANGFYRIGANFDLGLQYEFNRNTKELTGLFQKFQHALKFIMIFNTDIIFNNHFDERESLLNLEHGYIQ